MSRSPSAAPTRRRDIQGLRALAVALVVVEHLSGVPAGGFVGVDVFFVISGFLITGLLLREHARTGRISIPDFLRRRVRRLLPAAAATLVLTLAAASVLLPRARVEAIGVDAVWSALLAANWHFAAIGTDYFASDGPVSPFQHFWSLAVEEQFYVVWPLAVLLLLGTGGSGRRARAWLLTLSALVVVASFAVALVQSTTEPTVAYFSTLTRGWELGVGAVLAVMVGAFRRMPSSLGTAASWAGLAGIVVAAVLIDGTDPFPAPWALLPVLGTALVIVGGSVRGARTPIVLANPVSDQLGAVSYSLYLWHFPVFVLVTAVAPDTVWVAYPLALALAFVCHHGVERPLMHSPWLESGVRSRRVGRSRSSGWRQWRRDNAPGFRAAALGTATLAAVVAITLAAERTAPRVVPAAAAGAVSAAASAAPDPDDAGTGAGTAGSADDDGTDTTPELAALGAELLDALGSTSWPALQPSMADFLGDGRPTSPTNDCANLARPLPQTECTFGSESAPRTVFLVGDSTAAYERPAFERIVDESDGALRLVSRTAWSCPFMDVSASPECTAYRQETLSMIEAERPDLVVLTNTYQPVERDGRPLSATETTTALRAFVEPVRAATDDLVLLAPPPAGPSVESCYREQGTPADCLGSVSAAWSERSSVDQRIAATVDATWIDSRPFVCSGGACPAFAGDLLVRQDATHYAYPFAQRLAGPVRESFARVEVPLTG